MPQGLGDVMAKLLRVILVALLALVVGGSAAWAGQGPMNPVPIKGTLTGTHWVDMEPETCQPGAFNFVSVGTGNVSHLGTVDYVLDNCTTLDFATMTVSIEGTLTFTAANGDVLVLTQEGSGPFDPTANPTSVSADYDWTVNGADSTERFDGASGSGTSTTVSTVQADPEVTHAWLTGAIQYDASNRGNR